MIVKGYVKGSVSQAKPLIVGKDTVYIHTDIQLVDVQLGLYSYHEVQYTKDEYIGIINNRVSDLETLVLQLGGII